MTLASRGGVLALAAAVLTGVAGLSSAGDRLATVHDDVMRQLRASLPSPVAEADPTERALPRATCGPGSAPETGLQGEVPAKDVDSGRAAKPYSCNLRQLNKPLGEGAGLQAAYYKDCAYYGMLGLEPGVRVVDARDRRNPRITTILTTPAMLDPWESLKVHAGRGLLAAVQGTVDGPVFFDVYDIKADCSRPVLKASLPFNTLGHEGNWSQDGLIYYASSAGPGLITALDVEDPEAPRLITTTLVSIATGHGLSTNKAGTRLYTVDSSVAGRNGFIILDTTQVKAGVFGTQPPVVSELRWSDGAFAQHTIPVFYGKRPYVIHVDEHSYGGARIIDIADDTRPRVVTKLRTEIQLSRNTTRREQTQDSTGFGYNLHYCNVDRLDNPTVLACSSRASGVRVYDIRNVLKPREIAYLNLGGGMSAQVHLDAARGELWTTDGANGLVVAQFTNGTWPFRGGK